MNANLLRRWIQEHERYGDHEVEVVPMPVKRDIDAQFIALPTPAAKPRVLKQEEVAPRTR